MCMNVLVVISKVGYSCFNEWVLSYLFFYGIRIVSGFIVHLFEIDCYNKLICFLFI